ncbi:RNA polymerase sigma-70 factor, ECF subfamily [Neorhodopirellula lusitana]|uniref:RNA polymerase sigma-70 factor, ECF subfamily n=1 Tax=Neorhodopirellula lusitana TaxID=445327 RepID=A0ABY1PMN4_9BACT|nr:sigma-70 family RNA polymerase sigma factor [Neorhodopirellula lusitana]SMP37701.1 RNA polymerase sigma-70 factor, ECF subfamily [Neorhodopirellula lusitana]
MSLSDVDRQLLQRCLDREPRAWQNFVDRFVGLVVHVVHRTTSGRGLSIDEATRDDFVAEVFLVLIRHDFAVLRRFRRQCSLATYLTVIARRVVVRKIQEMTQEPAASANGADFDSFAEGNGQASSPNHEIQRIENAEVVENLMTRLDDREANVVRMFHLEGKSYQEISQAVGLNENTIGPLLNRARQKMGS